MNTKTRFRTGHHSATQYLFRLTLLVGLASFSTALQAGGIAVGDQGAVAAGRSGAFVAKADDASAIEYNPAGLTALKGWQLYLGNRFGYDNTQFKRAPLWDFNEYEPTYRTFKTVSNEKPFILLGPMLALTTDFGLKNWTFAIGAYAPSGVARKQFPSDVGEIVDGEEISAGQRYMLTDMDTKILYYNFSVAWSPNPKFGIGVSFQWVDLAQLDLKMIVIGDTTDAVVTPVSHSVDMQAHLHGADHVGFSGILGLWYRPVRSFQFGFSSRFVPTKFEANAKLDLAPANDSNSTDSVSVGREIESDDNGPPKLDGNNDVKFSMTMPMEFRAGFRYINYRGDRELFDFELDARVELWSQNDAYRIDAGSMHAQYIGYDVPVGKIVIPKNWKNTFSLRLGGDVNIVDNRFKLRAGTFFESAAVDKAYAYVDFMASYRLGGSLGFSLTFGNFDVALSYAYIIEVPYTVSEKEGKIYQQMPGSPCEGPDYDDPEHCNEHYYGQPSATANAGTYIGSYHFSSLALSYKF